MTTFERYEELAAFLERVGQCTAADAIRHLRRALLYATARGSGSRSPVEEQAGAILAATAEPGDRQEG